MAVQTESLEMKAVAPRSDLRKTYGFQGKSPMFGSGKQAAEEA
ncbi:MAG TPA: hypothetical protein VMI06_13605 [Terriglobia bacterium]|nr:hypothetical protein [Terriglobia bacterium]